MSSRNSPRPWGILKNDYFDPVASPSSLLGMSQGMSPRSTPKSLSFAPQAEVISPLMLGNMKDVDDLDLDRVPSHRRPKVKGPGSKRLSGRPSTQSSITSLQSFLEEANDTAESEATSSQPEQHHFNSGLVGQITTWLRDEKHKHEARRTKRKTKATSSHANDTAQPHIDGANPLKDLIDDQDDEVDFGKLEQILKDFLPSKSSSSTRRPSISLRRKTSTRVLHRASTTSVGASSDTEYFDGDAVVPSAEAVLDNSKTLGYNGGGLQSTDDLALTRTMTSSQEAWSRFKFEIVRLTHTLRLKGWRRVPMDMSNEIEVSRLSGALTNAVYVVSPPQDIPQPESTDEKPAPKKKPPKLLLRIYGPQVEHLIDRDSELQILKRLARKKIGPRLLGTFSNGRFEEYFHASPLTPEDLRNSGTSRQIAKRMRELHDGIELLDKERDDGPFVWRNWDKWVQRVEEIVLWLDNQVKKEQAPGEAAITKSDRAFICGTEWHIFNKVVKEYRKWLLKQAGGPQRQRNQLVFAHNDTQYGNILRVLPSGTSPLLLPANTHKQLIVIDFEYANANTPGLEFANHFTEWCYNYHDANAPWRINTAGYPNAEEQDRFIRAYVRHRPDFNIQTPKMTPLATLPEGRTHSRTASRDSQGQSSETRPGDRRPGPLQSISNFVHDARGPPSAGITPPGFTTLPPPSVNEPTEVSEDEETQVAALRKQTRVWRMANTAQWVAWGIVQAKIPGMPLVSSSEDIESQNKELTDGVNDAMTDMSLNGHTAQNAAESEQDAEEEAAEEEFDYLSYARDRAMFFWGDAVKLGFVKLEELPADVRRDVKIVEY